MQSRVSFKTTYTCMIHLVSFKTPSQVKNGRHLSRRLSADNAGTEPVRSWTLREPQLHDPISTTRIIAAWSDTSYMNHSYTIYSHTIHSYMKLPRISNHLMPCASRERNRNHMWRLITPLVELPNKQTVLSSRKPSGNPTSISTLK